MCALNRLVDDNGGDDATAQRLFLVFPQQVIVGVLCTLGKHEACFLLKAGVECCDRPKLHFHQYPLFSHFLTPICMTVDFGIFLMTVGAG